MERGSSEELFFPVPKITFYCSSNVLVRKPSQPPALTDETLRSWLSPEPGAVLRCPSKPGPRQLEGSSYLRGE